MEPAVPAGSYLPTYLPTYLDTYLPTYPNPTLPYPTLPYPTLPYPTLPYPTLLSLPTLHTYLPTYLPYTACTSLHTYPAYLPTYPPTLPTHLKDERAGRIGVSIQRALQAVLPSDVRSHACTAQQGCPESVYRVGRNRTGHTQAPLHLRLYARDCAHCEYCAHYGYCALWLAGYYRLLSSDGCAQRRSAHSARTCGAPAPAAARRARTAQTQNHAPCRLGPALARAVDAMALSGFRAAGVRQRTVRPTQPRLGTARPGQHACVQVRAHELGTMQARCSRRRTQGRGAVRRWLRAGTHARAQAHTHAHTHAHVCKHTCARTHAHTHPRTRARTRAHTRVHTCMHTRACTHAHAHTRTHTRARAKAHAHTSTKRERCAGLSPLVFDAAILDKYRRAKSVTLRLTRQESQRRYAARIIVANKGYS